MFDTSFGLSIGSFLSNIFVALVPWVLFMRLCFGTKRKGMMLYLLSRFIGVGIIANRMFDLQFVRFGIGLTEYWILLWVLVASLGIKIVITKISLSEYLTTLKVSFPFSQIKKSFLSLNTIEKIWTILISLFGMLFMLNSLVFTINFPTYADDSFNNRNKPIVNILHDGWVKLFGSTWEILARSRLGYPLHIPIYKVVISQFNGGYNDVYNNLFQYFTLLFGFIFIMIITREKTRNIFLTVLPVWLICSLPLIFIHSVEWYMELPSAIYSVLVIWALYQFLASKERDSLILGLFLAWILMYIKNDGFVVYMGGIILSLFIVLLLQNNIISVIKSVFISIRHLLIICFSVLFCFSPFLFIKFYHWLWFNQAAGETSGVALSIHREIFDVIPWLFSTMDNYGLVLIMLWFILYILVKLYHQKKYNQMFFCMSWICIGILFLAVFLFTENYAFVMNQTTVNRVFTTTFLILFSFFSIMYYESSSDNKKV